MQNFLAKIIDDKLSQTNLYTMNWLKIRMDKICDKSLESLINDLLNYTFMKTHFYNNNFNCLTQEKLGVISGI